MLPSAVAQLLPTPTTSPTEKSTRALTASSENGRRSGGGQSSSLGLTEVANLVSGVRPKNLPVDEELPPASRAIVDQLLPTPMSSDGERESLTFGRGNPTLLGAITKPPSDSGSESSDVQCPGQLTFEAG
jgi:hypothetical protein